MAARFAFLDHPGPIPFAHRGGASEFPENTMPAFEGAIRMGYRYLETDVHITADGVVVAFHDSRLDRVTDGHGVIEQLPWSTVGAAKVDGREPIPRLADLLGTFPAAMINIDAKSDAVVDPLIAELRRTNAVERVCIGSFSDKRLARIRAALGPTLCTSFGPREVAAARLNSWKMPVRAPTAPVAQVPVRQGPLPVVDRAFITALHRRDQAVHVWTIDDEPTMVRLLELGVDGIMTDRPAVLKAVMETRGVWPNY
jgi:glycerophosphoryl diester phosphodiesterase